MNRKNVIALGITVLCTALILGIGYAGVVTGGNFLLSNEEAPQKAEFENTSSNIFYGKIEDDIQLYPWNYYGQNEIEESLSEIMDYPENKNIGYLEEMVKWMEAYCCEVDTGTIEDIYEQKQSKIADNIKISNTDNGLIFFYQDILEVNRVRYQVKLAFDEWSILSFSCMEYRESDVRETVEWEEGKKLLTEMLDQYQDEIAGQLYDMRGLYLNAYNMKELEYDIFERYVVNMETLRAIQEAVSNGTTYKSEMLYGDTYDATNEEWQAAGQKEYSVIYSDTAGASCQVIELNDMILLLIQGNDTIGLFYDPVSQKFCGYNYFWE